MTETAEQTIERLTDEVAYWKSEAMRAASADTVERIRCGLSLTAGEAWIVSRVHAARGAVVLTEHLLEDLPGKGWEERSETSNTLQVLVFRIRAKIGADAVLTARCHGYKASEDLIARIDGILS